MIKKNLHIEIVRSNNTTLSSMSQPSADAILAVLSKKYTNVGITIINNLTDLKSISTDKPDLVFLGMEFVPKIESLGIDDHEKIWVTDYLDSIGVPYTGSSSNAHKLQRNKGMAKQSVLAAGLNSSKYITVKRNETLEDVDFNLSFPVFVKPLDRGGGYGIDNGSIVNNLSKLIERIDYISKEIGSDSLIEEYLSGREFSVAIIKNIKKNEYIAMPIELVAPMNMNGHRLLGNEVKSSNSETVSMVSDEELNKVVSDLALRVFENLGAKDYGRIDIRQDSFGNAHFLEANLIPSLIINYGSFPKACVINIDLNYEDMILQIVELGLIK